MNHRRYDEEREEAKRMFRVTGIIVNHWAAGDVLMDCIGDGRPFPDALVEFLAGSRADAHGNPLEDAERADLLMFYHRQGQISDAQLNRAFDDYPELADAPLPPPEEDL
ncbi:MAG TPA: hypothetical protein VHL31_03210 [Geminicoccus sp.]|jgi:hypothetical protein|uniref:hypothetical protein n=1 Tax=Geminicoccus sp. TaxID=2024832 RepID=UPI002E34E3E1|nr:hypothetical protein [Geminicoccus sp.]HEX2525295.1 hypothetical protein [Geminicoccus sp.]